MVTLSQSLWKILSASSDEIHLEALLMSFLSVTCMVYHVKSSSLIWQCSLADPDRPDSPQQMQVGKLTSTVSGGLYVPALHHLSWELVVSFPMPLTQSTPGSAIFMLACLLLLSGQGPQWDVGDTMRAYPDQSLENG